jgi:hypothetical protein
MQATSTKFSHAGQSATRAINTQHMSESRFVAPSHAGGLLPLDPLVESIWRNFVDTDRVPVLVLPPSAEPKGQFLVSLARSLARVSDRAVRIDWHPPQQRGGWWYRHQRRRWIDKAHRWIGLAPIAIQLTSVIGRQYSSNDRKPAISGHPDANQNEVWFRIGISGPDAEMPPWAVPILLAL